tara:strand:+ start:306 stop:440 length:135 start_codon:yes stop_codon:yes gene_type:complete
MNEDNPTCLVISFVVVILTTIAIIVAGYIHGNMHLITTLKNAHG